jgi:hypothetical protein
MKHCEKLGLFKLKNGKGGDSMVMAVTIDHPE